MLKHLDWGVYGLVIGNVTFALIVCILNWFSIGKVLRYRQEVKTTFLLPRVASSIMGAAALGTYQGIFFLTHSNTISVIVSVLLAMAVYAILLALLRVVTEEELPEMPFGRKLLTLFRMLHLM